MRHARFIAGMMVALVATPASAAGLYDQVRYAVDQETRSTMIEDEVATFVANVMREKNPEWKDITAKDVLTAISGDLAGLCDNKPDMSDSSKCVNFARQITTLARREQDLRAFGRRLEVIASRDELPVDGLRGNATDFAMHEQAILNIWLAGSGTVKTGMLPTFRDLALPEGSLDGLVDGVRSALEALPREELIAAVWRYRHGTRLIEEQRLPDYAPPNINGAIADTERQYLLNRWPGVESALDALWSTILASSADLQLKNGEYGVLLPLPLVKKDQRTERGVPPLTENILVWGRVDHDMSGLHPLGDVGLLWEFPIEPVLPALNGSKPILGGAFPPDAEDGTGLCSHPIAKQGYLCRPLKADPDGTCAEKAPDDVSAITLTACSDEGFGDFTWAGPEICRDIDWHSVDEEDKKHTCNLKVSCSDSCINFPDADWHTYAKEENGDLYVCVQEGSAMPAQYNLMRATAIADIVCNETFDEQLNDSPEFDCCRVMAEGQQAACRMMEEDGVFQNEDGTIAYSSEGIPFTTETCTEVMTQRECINVTCPGSRQYKSADGEYLLADEIVERAQSIVGGKSCSEEIRAPDPRLSGVMNAIKHRDDIGRPGRVITFRNSIGNLLCAAGQYLEESMKRHNLGAGRIPYTGMDQAFPWSVQGLMDPMPTAVGSGANLPLIAPAQGGGSLPSYHPALLAKTFDIAVCGEAGLPPRVPPELCMLDAQRRIDLPLMTFFATAQGAIGESQDIAEATMLAEQAGVAIGARMGNGYYAEYLRTALRSLTDVLDGTENVLERLRTIGSPSLMCPGPDTPPLNGGTALSAAARSSASSEQ